MRLKRLLVEDFLLVKRADLEFSEAFNVLTGETGAGKTMLLSAIAAVAGARIDWELFGQSNALVEAVFEDGPETVVVRRQLSARGKRSRIWVNGEQVPLARLHEMF